MNKKNILLLLTAMVAALIIIGASVYAYNNGFFDGDPEITRDEAKSIAEKHINGKAISVDMEKEGLNIVYEVIVENETGIYEVEIDGKDGSILEIEEADDDDDDDDDEHEEYEDDDDDDGEHEESENDDDNEHEFEGEEEGEH